MILKLLHIITWKVPNLRFLFVLRSVNSFAMSMVESLSVLSLCMFKTVRLLNRSWFILERSHVFSLRAVEKDLSPASPVAGFTRMSSHNVITSFITFILKSLVILAIWLDLNSAIYSQIAPFFTLNRILSVTDQNESEIILTYQISWISKY